MAITEMGMPTATEILDSVTPQYLAGLICWAAIGARTTESQTHREMASGLSMPVGFKNCTDGNLGNAVNGIVASGSPQSFLGVDPEGRVCIVKTTGNPFSHLVLRGGRRPNYDSVSIREAVRVLETRGLNTAVIVDCSHDNSGKRFQGQAVVWQDVLDQIEHGNGRIRGLMLESHLCEGSQGIPECLGDLKYGVSVTDGCISWETTEALIRGGHEQLRRFFDDTREATL
jgi:3-deoxy-7-phosphoheptulonate synthase